MVSRHAQNKEADRPPADGKEWLAKVLLAVDGSRSAGRARDLTASIRWSSGTRIEVLHVDQLLEGDLNLPPDRYTALHERERKFIDKQLETAARALRGPNRTVRAKTVLGRPASVIVEEAARIGADLVIVGSHGRGPFASAVLGSVAAEVVDHAPCPVLVARGTTLKRAVLAEDGSPGARTAERLLIKWPFLKKLPVRVVTVMNLLPLYNFSSTGFGGTEVIDADMMQKRLDDTRHLNERTAAQGAKRLTTAGLAAKAEVREGNPSQQVIAAAASTRANLIVLGSRGNTGLARLVLGSVAHSVLLHAKCSVLITRSKGK